MVMNAMVGSAKITQKKTQVSKRFMNYIEIPGWCPIPKQLLICSSFSNEIVLCSFAHAPSKYFYLLLVPKYFFHG